MPLLAGFAPAVTALIVRALDRIGRHTLTDKLLWVIAAASIILTLLDIHFLLEFPNAQVMIHQDPVGDTKDSRHKDGGEQETI